MRALAAVLWLDWRLVRRDWIAAVVFCVLMPIVPRLAASGEAADLTLSFFLLPLAGALLGCTLASREQGLAFLQSRALDWSKVVALRLAHRAVLAIALVAIARLALSLHSGGASFFGPKGDVGLILTLLGAAAIAGAFVRQPLTAVPTGALGLQLVAVLLSLSSGPSLWGLALHPLFGVWMLCLAFVVCFVRGSDSPMRWRRWVLGTLITLSTIGGGGWALAEFAVRREVASAVAAWSWLDASPGPTSATIEELEAAMRVLEDVGLTAGSVDGRRWLPRHSQSTWLREATLGLQREMRAAGSGNVSLTPSEVLERGLGGGREELDRAVTSLATSGRFPMVVEALGNGSLSDLVTLLIADAIVSQDSGDTDRAARSLGLAGRLLAETLRTFYWSSLENTTSLYVEYDTAHARRGVRVEREQLHRLAGLDLRSRTIRTSRDDCASILESMRSVPWALWWRHEYAMSHAGRGQAFRDLAASNSCELPESLNPTESDSWHSARRLWVQAVAIELTADLRLLVDSRRSGLPLDLHSPCGGTRWMHETHPDGSWSIWLEGGDAKYPHDEAAPSNTQRD